MRSGTVLNKRKVTHDIIKSGIKGHQFIHYWGMIMDRSIRKKIIELFAVTVAFSFMTGCASKATGNTTHVESGPVLAIVEQISDDCKKNNDVQGAADVWDTYSCLLAFGCQSGTEVKYDDVKNRNYENIELVIGDLQLSVAAYNEYNDESAMDIEVDWICHYNSCTKAQLNAIDAYVDWYHTQKGNVQIEEYRELVGHKYDEIKQNYDVSNTPPYDRLTPAQFSEVQNYIKDSSYQVDTSVWE